MLLHGLKESAVPAALHMLHEQTFSVLVDGHTIFGIHLVELIDAHLVRKMLAASDDDIHFKTLNAMTGSGQGNAAVG